MYEFSAREVSLAVMCYSNIYDQFVYFISRARSRYRFLAWQTAQLSDSQMFVQKPQRSHWLWTINLQRQLIETLPVRVPINRSRTENNRQPMIEKSQKMWFLQMLTVHFICGIQPEWASVRPSTSLLGIILLQSRWVQNHYYDVQTKWLIFLMYRLQVHVLKYLKKTIGENICLFATQMYCYALCRHFCWELVLQKKTFHCQRITATYYLHELYLRVT